LVAIFNIEFVKWKLEIDNRVNFYFVTFSTANWKSIVPTVHRLEIDNQVNFYFVTFSTANWKSIGPIVHRPKIASPKIK
jgi:hypothetical protein